MEAFFDARKHPKIRFMVSGVRKSQRVEAVIDTGFDGYLSLPISVAVSLGLELFGLEAVEYADGRTSNELVFLVQLEFDGKKRTVPATLTQSTQTLAGNSLFDNYSILFDFPRQKITIEKNIG